MYLPRFLSTFRKQENDVNLALAALRSGDVTKLKRLYSNDYDFTARIDGETPLYHACVAGQLEVVKYLLEIGAVSEYRRCLASTPSSSKGREIRIILIRYRNSHRPVESTVTDQVSNRTDRNIRRGNKATSFDEVFVAAKTGDVQKLRALAQQGKNIWLKHPLEKRTPLFYASAGAHVEAVEYLLNSGADDFDCTCQWAAPEGPRGDQVRELLSEKRRGAPQIHSISKVLESSYELGPQDLSCTSDLHGELEPCLDADNFSSDNPSEGGDHSTLFEELSLDALAFTSVGEHQRCIVGQQQAQSESTEGTCCVCMENPAKLACVPCGHLSLCSECWECIQRSNVRKCPVCRKDTTAALQIFKV